MKYLEILIICLILIFLLILIGFTFGAVNVINIY